VTILSLHYTSILFIWNRYYPYFLSIIEGTSVEPTHAVGKLLQGEFSLVQADWSFIFSTS